ncbi:hypothetical protein DL98DRAFT_602785 [Cadophora sp. DSE1049]|nr:hypothetical protein DL98DRAFT_602785 [Cadophora sp. DSE1049]
MPNIDASIGFLADLPAYEKVKPYLMLVPVESSSDPENPDLTNLVYEQRLVKIRDIRYDGTLSLDTHGAQLLSHTSRFKFESFSSPSELTAYRAEVDELLYTTFGSFIWRPLNDDPVEDYPLTVCDGRTVDSKDIVPADRVFPGYHGEVYQVKYSPKQEWLWCEHQTSSEPFAVLMYDTCPSGTARLCPHTSFANPRAKPNAQPRKSVEARTLVITRIPDDTKDPKTVSDAPGSHSGT